MAEALMPRYETIHLLTNRRVENNDADRAIELEIGLRPSFRPLSCSQ